MHVGIDPAAHHLPLSNHNSGVVAVDLGVLNVQDGPARISIDAVSYVFTDDRIGDGNIAGEFNAGSISINSQVIPGAAAAPFLPNTRPAIIINGCSIDVDDGCGNIKAPTVITAEEVLNGSTGSSDDLHPIKIALVIVRRNILQQGKIAVSVDEDAVPKIVAHRQSFRD